MADCGPQKCLFPVFSPDGTQLAFQRGELPSAQISLLDLATGRETGVSPNGHPSASPDWNPRGWLSYYDSERQAIALDDLHGGTSYLPILGGANWSWAPDGLSLVIPEIVMTESAASGFDESGSEGSTRLYNQLVRIRTSDNQAANLSGNQPWDDASPSISPDGARMAFARQKLGKEFTAGRQLWMMDLARGESHALTNDSEYNFSAIQWSPDGQWLAYMRFHVTAPMDPPEVWVSLADGTRSLRLSIGGYLPRWLP
jgi:Tol biopolymer transport system component